MFVVVELIFVSNFFRSSKPRLRSSSKFSNSESYSFGEPSSPPLSSSNSEICDLEELSNGFDDTTTMHHQSQMVENRQESRQLDEDIGIDKDALMYELDCESGFELDNGTHLEGQALPNHLIHTNNKLKDKVKIYHQKCNDLQEAVFEEQNKSYKKIQNVRMFYQNQSYIRSSRGAKMLAMALNKKNKDTMSCETDNL